LPFPVAATIEGDMNSISNSAVYRPDVKITSLGEKIGDPVLPANFPEAIIRFRNDRAAASVGLNGLTDAEWVSHFALFHPLPNNMPAPLALRYHGHQFRNYNPDIGDGRGFLFAQLRDQTGRLLDLGTKGSGPTPYSRAGDGRLTLKGGVREILATEMLEALGVYTSRTFSLIETGEALMRGDEPSPTRSAVLVRLNHSHIRFGTFQRIAFEGNFEMMEQLVGYCLTHLYGVPIGEDPAAQLLELVAGRVADLAASYMVSGFVHGVLNTDNINITGESFDYGPWRFTPKWDPRFTAAYFDEHGLYAFGRQAETMHWNLGQLAVSLRLICEAPPLIAVLEGFSTLFQAALVKRFVWRLGLQSIDAATDRQLVEFAERAMITGAINIDAFFHAHRGGLFRQKMEGSDAYLQFLKLLASYEAVSGPHAYWDEAQICSMHLDEVESIWGSIALHDDWTALQNKVATIRRMGDAHAI
jgi:serine/tyrosine/threonine adenylyltransferase